MIVDSLVGGLITSAIGTIVILGLFAWYPEGFINELTEGREPTPKTVQSFVGFALVIGTVLGGAIATTWWVAGEHGLGFGGRLLVAWSVIAVLNLVDLVLIDIVIYTWIYPSFMEVPGYPPMHDYRVHTLGAVKGTIVLGLPAAILVAAVTSAA